MTKKQQGFTLIELLIALTIGAFLVGGRLLGGQAHRTYYALGDVRAVILEGTIESPPGSEVEEEDEAP